MDTHVRVLGVLNIAIGVIGLIVAALMLIGVGGAAGIISASAEPEEAAMAIPILSIVGAFLVVVLFAFSLPAIVTGIGLLYFKPWARVLGIVLSVDRAPRLPLGHDSRDLRSLGALQQGHRAPLCPRGLRRMR